MKIPTKNEIAFLKENFHFKTLQLIGFYTANIRENDYAMQIERICHYYGIETIFQYQTIMVDTWQKLETNISTFSKN